MASEPVAMDVETPQQRLADPQQAPAGTHAEHGQQQAAELAEAQSQPQQKQQQGAGPLPSAASNQQQQPAEPPSQQQQQHPPLQPKQQAPAQPSGASDPRLARCGFAKLLGDGVEYYIQKYEVSLGRRSKAGGADVVLGDNMSISRQHAAIAFDFDRHAWLLRVSGKNGVMVNGALHTPATPEFSVVLLRSQDFIQVADRSFFFLLPCTCKARPGEGKPPAKRRRTTSAGGGAAAPAGLGMGGGTATASQAQGAATTQAPAATSASAQPESRAQQGVAAQPQSSLAQPPLSAPAQHGEQAVAAAAEAGTATAPAAAAAAAPAAGGGSGGSPLLPPPGTPVLEFGGDSGEVEDAAGLQPAAHAGYGSDADPGAEAAAAVEDLNRGGRAF